MLKMAVKSSRPPERRSIRTKAEGRRHLTPDLSRGRSRGSFVKLASLIQLCNNLKPAMSPHSQTPPLLSVTHRNTTFITHIPLTSHISHTYTHTQGIQHIYRIHESKQVKLIKIYFIICSQKVKYYTRFLLLLRFNCLNLKPTRVVSSHTIPLPPAVPRSGLRVSSLRHSSVL